MSARLTLLVAILTLSSILALEELPNTGTFKELSSFFKKIPSSVTKSLREFENQNDNKISQWTNFLPVEKGNQPQERRENQNQFENFLLGSKEVVDSFIRSVMKCKHVPALSVAVVKDGQSWTEGFGAQDMKSGVPADSGTLFGVGSVTKGFTSALLAIALQEAQSLGNPISWQTKMKELMAEDFELTNQLQVNVTLEDVLSHRTGLMAADLMAVAGFPPQFSRAEFLRQLRYLPDFLPFRSSWYYNNWIYSLAGDVTENLLGDSWENLLKQRLLWPVGMKDSLIVWHDVNVTSSKMARPYQRIKGSFQELDESLYDLRQGRPAGSLAVSADDMAKWMKFLLRGGEGDGGEPLISKRLKKDMMSVHVPFPGGYKDVLVGDTFEGYGFGWFTGAYREKAKVTHPGGWFGYECTLTLFPEDDVAVFVAVSGPGTSASSQAYRTISYFLSDLALGYSPWLNQSTACVFGEEDKEKNNEDKKEIIRNEDEENRDLNIIKNSDMYIGQYSHPLFGDILIQNSSAYNGLVFKFQRLEGFLIPTEKEFEFELEYTGKTAFYSTDDFEVKRSKLSFSRYFMTADGKCSSLVLRAPPPENHERMAFTRKEQ